MDAYREKCRRAQQYADRVLLLKKGRFLDGVSAGAVRLDRLSYVPGIARWYRLLGCRTPGEEERMTAALTRAAGGWIRSAVGSGRSAAFALQRGGGVLSVLYGSGREDFAGSFRASVPECDLLPAEWPESGYACTGLVTGTVSAERLADVFASSGLDGVYAACVIVPISDAEIRSKLEENRGLIAWFEPYKSFQRTYGSASRRVEEVPVQSVVQAIAALREENEYLERNAGGGFVRTVLRFGAGTREDCRALGALIRSCIRYGGDPGTAFEPPRILTLEQPCRGWRDCLAVPYAELGEAGASERLYTVTLQDIESAASCCLPPLRSYDGYYVKDYDVGEDAPDAFPVTRPAEERGAELGEVCRSGWKAVVPFSALHAHALVAGATDTGKTTTVKKLLMELREAGIPFTVIEAAKKEYISLIGSIPELRVYTPGSDGVMLAFNPLQPEDGELIENHAEAVVRALVASAGGEHPIPEAFAGLLKQTYAKAGWEYGMLAYTDEHRPFPTFGDVLDNVDSYIDAHARYGPEVRQNLTAALTLRAENLRSGALGRLFGQASGLQSADLLASPCVIELADFPPQSCAFIMNILLYKFHRYLARQPESAQLKRVIVVEEAHNVFKRTLAEDTGRALNNEYFDKMLAEIRSSGTGLILADQRPGILSDAVMANTAVKIVHALTEAGDRQTVGAGIGLSDFQQRKLGEFGKGECVVSVRGRHGVQHVQVSPARESADFQPACHVCSSRFRCRRDGVRRMLEGADHARVAFHVSRIQAEPYNTSTLEANVTAMLRDMQITAGAATKLCLLGEILDGFSASPAGEKRVIVSSYANYLRRRGTNE